MNMDILKNDELIRFYDTLQTEQKRLVDELKKEDCRDPPSTQRQITALNHLTLLILKYRNLRLAIKKKLED